MLKAVPRAALNNSQRLAFPKTCPGASTAVHCISPGWDYPTSFCPLEWKGQFPSLTARPDLKHLWGFTSLLGKARDLGEVLSLLINPCQLLWPFFCLFLHFHTICLPNKLVPLEKEVSSSGQSYTPLPFSQGIPLQSISSGGEWAEFMAAQPQPQTQQALFITLPRGINLLH